MEHESPLTIMIVLAVATPVVGACMLIMGRIGARQSGAPMPPAMRRAGLLLLIAGPLNLLAWLLFNRWLDAIGYRSVIGYILAAAVFLALGWTTGAFSRVRERFSRRFPGND
jgi:hypothetical protein